ncbi:hypothetical protein [Fimbriiglobus ruber]|uniref:hypothetical protein n=1 Tax=Fimbriiglobus ruber TaxID=1908690 RepID=UPI00117B38F5|nr:hypothetical protein [Fimbriiglobus ruber]
MLSNIFGVRGDKKSVCGKSVRCATRLHCLHLDDRIVPSTYYVDVNSGNDLNAGTVSSSPLKSIQAAVNLALAASASGPSTIDVAKGDYQYTPSAANAAFSTAGVSAVVEVYPYSGSTPVNITIQGGFPGGDNWGASDPSLNQTTIDGSNSYRGVFVTGDVPGAGSASLTLNGFTVENGLGGTIANPADADLTNSVFDYGEGFGGGILTDESIVSLNNDVIENNKAVGGNADYIVTLPIYAKNLTNNTPIVQAGEGDGGGIAAMNASNLTMNTVKITSNQAYGGLAGSTDKNSPTYGITASGYAHGGGLFGGNSEPVWEVLF